MDKATPLGGLFFGKCLRAEPNKSLEKGVHERLRGLRFDDFELRRAMEKLRVMPIRQLAAAARFLFLQVRQIAGRSAAGKMAKRTRKSAGAGHRGAAIPSADKMKRLRPAMECMDYNYDRPITLAEVARSMKLSVWRLSHLFREQMGITPVTYLTGVRIRHAKRLLLTTDWECRQVGVAVGYRYQSYFIRTFKRIAGRTPQQFRLRHRHKK